MPHGEPDPQDPLLLVGVSLPSGPEAQREMAEVFADEFARMGYDTEKIMGLFRQPFYAGAHGALVELGEAEVLSIVEESVGVWGRVRLVDRDAESLLTVGSPEEFSGIEAAAKSLTQRDCDALSGIGAETRDQTDSGAPEANGRAARPDAGRSCSDSKGCGAPSGASDFDRGEGSKR